MSKRLSSAIWLICVCVSLVTAFCFCQTLKKNLTTSLNKSIEQARTTNKQTTPPDIDFPIITWAGGSSSSVSARVFACSPTSPSSSSASSSSSCLPTAPSASSRGKSTARETMRKEMFPCGHQHERQQQQVITPNGKHRVKCKKQGSNFRMQK
jgi:hypothetical protein